MWLWFWAAYRPEALAVNTPPAQRRVVEVMEWSKLVPENIETLGPAGSRDL